MTVTTVSRSARPAGSRKGYALTAAILVAVMLGGTLPIPLYTLYEPQMGFGPLGLTVVFAVYVIGTLSALLAFGDLSDHFGRRKVLAAAIAVILGATVIVARTFGHGGPGLHTVADGQPTSVATRPGTPGFTVAAVAERKAS